MYPSVCLSIYHASQLASQPTSHISLHPFQHACPVQDHESMIVSMPCLQVSLSLREIVNVRLCIQINCQSLTNLGSHECRKSMD